VIADWQVDSAEATRLIVLPTGKYVHTGRWHSHERRGCPPRSHRGKVCPGGHWSTGCHRFPDPEQVQDAAESELPLCPRCQFFLEGDVEAMGKKVGEAVEYALRVQRLHERLGAMLAEPEVPVG
jgi:hypothetical protein